MPSNDTTSLSDVLCALDGAHWLSGTAPERIRALIEEREAAVEGRHPVQRARGVILVASECHLDGEQAYHPGRAEYEVATNCSGSRFGDLSDYDKAKWIAAAVVKTATQCRSN